MESGFTDIKTFYQWVSFYKCRNINIGPINEALISLFEDVENTKLTETTKEQILRVEQLKN